MGVRSRQNLPPAANSNADRSFEARLDLILSAFHIDDAVYLPIQIMDKTFHGMLDSGASHVLVNKKGCQKVDTLGLSILV